MFEFGIFIPGDFTAEAETIISKYKNPQWLITYFFDRLGKDLVNYLDKPELIKEIFVIVDTKYGSHTAILPMVFHFTDALRDNQIQKLSDSYVGNQVLDRMLSLLLNIQLKIAEDYNKAAGVSDKTGQLAVKIQRSRIAQNISNGKPHVGDIVPNNTGISDRFGTGHDGIHVRSPKEGGNVITIEALKGVVIRQYLQEIASSESGNVRLYGVWVLLKSGIVVVYKDLLAVDAKLKKLETGKLYLLRNNPTSRVSVVAGDVIGIIRPWAKSDLTNMKNDIGLHLTFLHLKYVNDLKTYFGAKQNTAPFPLNKLIAPCGEESPVRCI